MRSGCRHVGIGWQDKGACTVAAGPAGPMGIPGLTKKDLTSTGKGGKVFSGNLLDKRRGKNPSPPPSGNRKQQSPPREEDEPGPAQEAPSRAPPTDPGFSGEPALRGKV